MYCGVPMAEPSCVAADCRWPTAVRQRLLGRAARRSAGSDRLGQAPVDDQRLAVFAEHDVARLQVAVQHAAAVGVGDGVADVDEPAEQAAAAPSGRSPGVAPALSAGGNGSMASFRLSPRMKRMA